MKKPVAFDAADYLDSDEVIAEYLNVALASEYPDLFLQAVADVAKAKLFENPNQRCCSRTPAR